MTDEEAKRFESQETFSAILQMRKWDEAAKDINKALRANAEYENIARNVLSTAYESFLMKQS